MFYLTVLYHVPTDLDAFMHYYFHTHAPIAKKLPGLIAYSVSEGPVSGADGSAAVYPLIAHLTFASHEAYTAAMSSPEGTAAVGDLANFATGGLTILSYASKTL